MALCRGAVFGVVTACLLCIASGAKFPIFRAIPDTYDKSTVVPALSKAFPEKMTAWYASWPTDMRLTLLGRAISINNFALNCFVQSLEKGSELTEMLFCFKTLCKKITTPGNVDYNLDSNGQQIALKIVYTTRNGGSVTYTGGTDKLSPMVDLSTKFHCVAKNRMGTVQSNNLKIVDLRKRTPKEPWFDISKSPPLKKNEPKQFLCLQKNVAPGSDEPPLLIEWGLCEEEGKVAPNRCSFKHLRSLSNSENWPIHIKPTGELYIPYFPDSIANGLDNRMLVCKLNKIWISYKKEPMQFSYQKSPYEIRSLEMTRPNKLEKVKIFDSGRTDVTFPCNFRVGPGKYTVNWTFRTKDGTSRVISKSNGVFIGSRPLPNMLTFRGSIMNGFTSETSGWYTCDVSWTPASGARTQRVSGTYEVEVLFFPTLSKAMVPLKYVVDGDDGVVKCLFDDRFPNARPGLKVTPSLAINGQSINLNSKLGVDDSIQNVNKEYAKVMASLNSEVKPLKPTAGQVITYTSKKMSIKSKLNNLPSTHTVQCIGNNDVGSVRTNTLLKVVPKPIMVVGKSPSSLNCTECSAAEPHTIRCDVANMADINASGIVFGQYWKLGTTRVEDMLASEKAPARKYIVLSPDNSLTIKKIDDEEFKKAVNDLGKLECVLTLGYPKGVKLPPEVKTTGVEAGLFFISSHTDMQKELTTTIKLTNIAPALKTGSMMWVIPVILALIVILIIIGAVYYCCRHKNSGEEYNVDAKEKQQGNDPEVEVAEKEAFPVFERPEDGPIRGSRASLDDSIHVGSDDEDEVLAEYDVDIGKFDEEGSFIGQYAVNDGTATGNRRLPQVGNNTEV